MDAPLFQFDTRSPFIPSQIEIGDTILPIRIKRPTHDEVDVFQFGWSQHIQPRGDLSMLSLDDQMARERAQRRWYQEVIEAYVSVEPGLLVHNEQPVTTGAELIDMWYARRDVISSLVSAIFTAIHVDESLAKNLKSPRASGTGSAPSIQARGEDKSDSTAGSVAPSTSAANSAVTDESGPLEGEPRSSGGSDEVIKVH